MSRAWNSGGDGAWDSGAGDTACGSLFRRLAGTSGESPDETQQASRLPHFHKRKPGRSPDSPFGPPPQSRIPR